MVKAYRMGEKAAGAGFDWEQKEDVWDKVREELGEVEAEMKSGSKTDLEGEFGDLLFALVNACRLYGVDPESALERTNKKFIQRFNYMEERAAAKGHTLHDMVARRDGGAVAGSQEKLIKNQKFRYGAYTKSPRA